MKKIVFTLLLFFSISYAQDYTFSSNENRVNIIELYTSQGCNSCPPADKWLSKLKEHPKLFKEFIPMAFHVTYWNYIGWKDVFSKKSNDNRQRYYAREIWKSPTVYTPQFITNAKEYRQWFSNRSFPSFEKKYGGKLKIIGENDTIKTSYYNKNIKAKKLHLNIAILGFDYKVNIKAGENRHKTLEHDFVVLEHIQKPIQLKNYTLENQTKIYDLKSDKKQAIAVWISDQDLNILQATGGYITNTSK